MPRLKRTLLVPAAGFALAFGLAVVVSLVGAASPEARLLARITAYMDALYRGDADAAAGYREDEDATVEWTRASALRGRKWYLADQRVDPASGRQAQVQVAWLTEDDVPLRAEIQIWRADREGRWRLWALDGGAPERRR